MSRFNGRLGKAIDFDCIASRYVVELEHSNQEPEPRNRPLLLVRPSLLVPERTRLDQDYPPGAPEPHPSLPAGRYVNPYLASSAHGNPGLECMGIK